MKKSLSHIDEKGNPGMVDVSGKNVTSRTAIAQATVILGQEIMTQLKTSGYQTRKGPVIHTAVIAGQMAVKKTSDLIPLCHPLPIEGCAIDVEAIEENLIITCTVKTLAKTGVEMEALTGVSVAALTIYDMVKALSHRIRIHNIHLISKTGGKSDFNG